MNNETLEDQISNRWKMFRADVEKYGVRAFYTVEEGGDKKSRAAMLISGDNPDFITPENMHSWQRLSRKERRLVKQHRKSMDQKIVKRLRKLGKI